MHSVRNKIRRVRQTTKKSCRIPLKLPPVYPKYQASYGDSFLERDSRSSLEEKKTSQKRCNNTTQRITLLLIQRGEKQKRYHPKSDFQLCQAAHFSTKNSINKPAMNNRRLLIAAVFHFVHPVGKDS